MHRFAEFQTLELAIICAVVFHLASRVTFSVPAGSEVTFYITSPDVQHGFKLEGTNVNMMIIPGQVSSLTQRFDTPGDYTWVCHEYCGAGHAAMYGTVTVTP